MACHPLAQREAAAACLERADISFPLSAHMLVTLAGTDRRVALAAFVRHAGRALLAMIELGLLKVTVTGHALAPCICPVASGSG